MEHERGAFKINYRASVALVRKARQKMPESQPLSAKCAKKGAGNLAKMTDLLRK
jgi:hypothetical protein